MTNGTKKSNVIGWRKLMAWAAVYLLGLGCWLTGKDIPANARDLIGWVTVALLGANVASKFIKNGNGGSGK